MKEPKVAHSGLHDNEIVSLVHHRIQELAKVEARAQSFIAGKVDGVDGRSKEVAFYILYGEWPTKTQKDRRDRAIHWVVEKITDYETDAGSHFFHIIDGVEKKCGCCLEGEQ